MGYTIEYTGTLTITPEIDQKLIDQWREATVGIFTNLEVNPLDSPFYESALPAGSRAPTDWTVSEDGGTIFHTGTEKSRQAVEWIEWLIENHLQPKGHSVNGRIEAQGERSDDRYLIRVDDNVVKRYEFERAVYSGEPDTTPGVITQPASTQRQLPSQPSEILY